MPQDHSNITPAEPDRHCARCPRLVAFRRANHKLYPDFYNGAVSSFGDKNARLLVLGLAPGLQGANKTGRPFTGDFSGVLLFDRARDAANVTTQETSNCRPYLLARLDALPRLRVIFALGKVAHDAALKTFGLKLAAYKFAHKAVHELPNGLTLVDSYHCSRYNVNTGRLTEDMFMEALRAAKQELA